jgi:cyclopropane-fatty-acyl-phospholipid synthase
MLIVITNKPHPLSFRARRGKRLDIEDDMNAATQLAIDLTERGWLPDPVMRRGIRQLVRARLNEIQADDCESMADESHRFVSEMNDAVIAPLPHKANEQHYEVPAEFFSLVLGQHRKYSSCFWPEGVENLNDAEAAALQMTCERADLQDGLRILELGCGWGSLTLWMASHYPGSYITAVSNSQSQRAFITAEAARRGLTNIEVITADMNDFDTDRGFDRVVSVEMLEHMRNYRKLFKRVHDWLVPGGRFFFHIFCHSAVPYAFEDKGPDDWMSRYFFSGGIMPSDDLPLRFQDDLRLRNHWRWNGTHYARTANAWIANMDRRRDQVWPILESTYGESEAQRWWVRWRIFFAACAELFAWNNGQAWWVSHYQFERPQQVLDASDSERAR